MLSIEADEAGKLRAFRERFGRGWDAGRREGEGEGDNLMDLIGGGGGGERSGGERR